MADSPLVPVDRARAEQFTLLGAAASACRLFQGYQIWTDAEGVVWAGAQHGGHGFAVTWLGSGWIFDPHARLHRADRLAAREEKLNQAKAGRHRRELERVLQGVRLGGLAGRLLWAVHQRLWTARRSVIRLPDYLLARAAWGQQDGRWPAHWRQDLLHILEGLTWLHLADWPDDGMPLLGESTALLTHVADLRGAAADACGEDCPGHLGPAHHHYLVNVGRGFLGELEPFAEADDATGLRTYSFPRGGPKSAGPSLWAVGKTGRLVSVFLPAKLGEPAACSAFSARQHRLLQAAVRETTRAKKKHKRDTAETQVFVGNQVKAFYGKKMIACPLLSEEGRHVGFNGNGLLKAHGYLLASEGGWLAKAGYPLTEVAAFLDDLAALAGPLGLAAVGVDRNCQFSSLEAMRAMTGTPQGRRALDRLHVRVYTGHDYLERWAATFQWEGVGSAVLAETPPADADTAALLAEMKAKKISRRALASGVEQDHSFLAKVLNGRKPWPKGLLEKARAWLVRQGKEARPVSAPARRRNRPSEDAPVLAIALACLRRGWSVVPQRPGAKKPCVKWKRYQTELPTEEEWRGWSCEWPDAGLALVLGPVSGVLVSDVDGPEAHAAMLARLGVEPVAPKALSGSGAAFRYHLYFECPDLPTKAKMTPWHPKLEFRGHGGIVVIPPSMHKSGKRYQWAPGLSPDEMDLPPVPPQILAALTPLPPSKLSRAAAGKSRPVPVGLDASPRTREFLSGKWSEGPGWNQRLFNAACDLCGREMPVEDAEPLLLAGAQPWNAGEEELARRTIQSAYSQPREPARL